MRKSLALILSAGVLLSLAACSSSPATPDCSGAAPSGASSDLVTASGSFGADPAATFPFPLVSTSTERSVLIPGTGDPVGLGGTVAVNYTAYDGQTGTAVAAPQSTAVVVSTALPDALREGLLCTSTGERVAIVLPHDQATGIVSSAVGSIVMVFDITAAFPQAANGTDQPAPSGFPSVVHDSTGRPGINITSNDAPTEAKSALLKKGDGAVIAAGDQVVVQSTSVSFDTKKVVDSTWEKGTPNLWTMTEAASSASGSTQPAGITQYLIGQTIGSEVIVVLPASTSSTGGSSAMVYVIDILGVLPTAGG